MSISYWSLELSPLLPWTSKHSARAPFLTGCPHSAPVTFPTEHRDSHTWNTLQCHLVSASVSNFLPKGRSEARSVLIETESPFFEWLSLPEKGLKIPEGCWYYSLRTHRPSQNLPSRTYLLLLCTSAESCSQINQLIQLKNNHPKKKADTSFQQPHKHPFNC